MVKKNKAYAIRELLKQGMSVREIRARITVSEAYAYTIKKLMELEQEQEREQEAPPLELTEEMKEMAYDLTQGTGRPKPGEFIETGTSIGTVLDERGARYGNFITQARIAQQLKNVAHTFAMQQGKTFDVDQAEAIDMILSKLARILNGDPHYADSWIDIAGYAKLVANRLEGKIQ
jgi:transposase